MSMFEIHGGFTGLAASSRVRLARNIKGYPFRLTEQQVLRADVAVAERSGRFLCKRQCLTGTLGKTVLIEHK